MVARYQLTVALVALVVGIVLAGVDRWARDPARRDAVTGIVVARVWALAALAGSLIGGWMSSRVLPWWIAAIAVLLVPDQPSRPHPLGRWATAMALLSLVGVWSAVPDTEPAVASAAVLAPLAASRWRRGPAPGPAGTAALAVLVVGAAWVGSAGRGAGLAAAAAVGMVVVAPAVLGWGRLPAGRASGVLVVAHAAVALVLPRAVMREPASTAAAVALAVSVGLVVVAGLVRRAVGGRSSGDGTSPG